MEQSSSGAMSNYMCSPTNDMFSDNPAGANSKPLSAQSQSAFPKATGRVRLLAMMVVGCGLTWILGYWIVRAEVVVLACQVTEAVPAIPGLGAFLVLLAINPLLRRLPFIRKLSTAELVVVYLFVTVATTMFGPGIIRFLIASLTVPYYYSTPALPLAQIATHIPGWLSPTEPTVHQWLWEGSPFGTVPWRPWLVPIAVWTGFFLLMGGTLLCLVSLVSRDWIHHERLVFPLVRLPLEIMESPTGGSFFRNRATWIGMGAAVLINAVDIVRAVVLGVGGGGGISISIGQQLEKYPWAAAFPLNARVRPELIGLGYLVSTELALSIWLFHMFHKLQALVVAAGGYRISGMPFAQEQGMGAYVVVGLILLWKSRDAFRQAWRGGWGRDDAAESVGESQRWLLAALVVGIGGMLLFMITAGMQPWLAALYLGLLLLVALTYARVRAEAGIPLVWAYPYSQQYQSIWNFMGTGRLTNSGTALASPTIFVLMQFLSRGYFPTVSGYEIEGVTLGERTGARWRDVAWSLLLGIGFGAAAGLIFHLRPYYARGAVGLRGGIWGWGDARREFARVLQAGTSPEPGRVPPMVATLFGGVFVLALTAAHAAWFSFPLHPIGYLVACSYGSLVWAPFLVVWLLKTLILRYGGSRLYLKALPGFLGFALGHFVTAGLIWGLLAAMLGGPFLRWGVWFG